MNDSTMMLQYLDMLIKHGTFTKAAKELSISQPYLTQTVKKVENNLGLEIINREAKPLQLTDAGKLYYQYLSALEIEQDIFFKKLSNITHSDSHTITVGVMHTLGKFLFPKFLHNFTKKYPYIRIDIQEQFPQVNEERAVKESIDFFIGQNAETASSDLIANSCPSLSYVAIIPETSHLYQPGKKYLHPEDLDLKDIFKEPLLLTSIGSAVRRQVDTLLHSFNMIPNIILESSNIFTVAELAKRGVGITITPRDILDPSDENYNLYPINKELISVSFFIAYSHNKELTPEENDFVNIFISSLTEFFKQNEER